MEQYIRDAEAAAEQRMHSKGTSSVDAELESILANQKANIRVVGCGGGGGNTINRITEVGIEGTETIAINTDAQDLLYCSADKKILIGKDLTKGLGAGSIPKVGEESAQEQVNEIRDAIQGADMIFITCGLGGGTGTGSAPVVAEVAKKQGALVVGIVTTPFSMEGGRRKDNAVYGLERLQDNVDTLIIIPNDKLLEIAPDLPIHTAFKVADEILTNAVKGMAELVTKAGLVNLDFADIRTVMGKGGVALIGVGESDTSDRAMEAVQKAINNPLLDADIKGANGALINVIGGQDMTLDEAKKVVEVISEQLDQDARIIWGAQLRDDLEGTMRVMLIVTGVSSTQITGSTKIKEVREHKKEEVKGELGIEFCRLMTLELVNCGMYDSGSEAIKLEYNGIEVACGVKHALSGFYLRWRVRSGVPIVPTFTDTSTEMFLKTMHIETPGVNLELIDGSFFDGDASPIYYPEDGEKKIRESGGSGILSVNAKIDRGIVNVGFTGEYNTTEDNVDLVEINVWACKYGAQIASEVLPGLMLATITESPKSDDSSKYRSILKTLRA